ncbi:O-antigen polymerase [Clostridium sp. DL1XJH146]
MQTLRIRKISLVIFLFVIITSIVTGIRVAIDVNKPDYYEILSLLPIAFGLTSLLFFNIYKIIPFNLGASLLVGLYFIRNVVTILIMSFGNYYSVFVVQFEKNIIYSVLLMIYETVIVFVAIQYYSKKYSDRKRENIKSDKDINLNKTGKKHLKIFGSTMLFSILLMVISYMIIPEIKLTFTNIFASGSIINNIGESDSILLVNRGGVRRILFTIFIFLFNFYRIFIPAISIYFIKVKAKNSSFAIFLSYLIIMSQIFFIFGQTVYVFIVMSVLTMLMMKLYPSKVKLIRFSLVLFMVVGIIVIFISKMEIGFNSSSKATSIAMMMQAYFPGIANIAGIFNIDNPSKISTLFYDLYYMIPFRNSIFGFQGERLVEVYNNSNNVYAQIIPCIGQAYYYLGVFSPIIPILFVKLTMKYSCKLRKENNILKYVTYALLLLYSATTPITYNITIFGSQYFSIILPMLLLSNYSGSDYNFSNVIINNKRRHKYECFASET